MKLRAVLAISLIALAFVVLIQPAKSYEQRRAENINEMTKLIDEIKDMGEYRCCINPPCDMCYLGHWIFENGSCGCDDMIAQGKYDKVCPQCMGAIESGTCESTN